MEMGTYIRKMRESLNVSQEELGKKLNPSVRRAAISKWENGDVENIKRVHIMQLSKIFGITPTQLLCFEETPNLISNIQWTSEDEEAVQEKLIEFIHGVSGAFAAFGGYSLNELDEETRKALISHQEKNLREKRMKAKEKGLI